MAFSHGYYIHQRSFFVLLRVTSWLKIKRKKPSCAFVAKIIIAAGGLDIKQRVVYYKLLGGKMTLNKKV